MLFYISNNGYSFTRSQRMLSLVPVMSSTCFTIGNFSKAWDAASAYCFA